MKEEKGREGKGLNGDKISEAITVFVMTAVIILAATIILQVMLRRDFERAESQLTTDVTFSSPIELWERLPDLQVFPWSQYHKHSTRELSQEELFFLQEKKIAECVVDMVNYDEMLIHDKDSAISSMYINARKLLTDDDDIYYVWNQFQVENIYLYVMVNLSGQIFSFRYVTDIECDGEEAIDYVLDSFEDSKRTYLLNEELSDFEKNRIKFMENTYQRLKDYKNLNPDIFYQNIDIKKKPNQVSQDSGSVLLVYLSETKYANYVFLYFDSKTKKVSGYHLMLY